MNKIPNLRFRGFEGEWEEKKLGEVCSVNRGVRVTRRDLDNDGSYPVYQNTNYPLGYYNMYNVEANNPFVIIGGSAGLMGFSSKPFWAADDCAYFGNSNIDKYFLYNTLLEHQNEIKQEVRGSSVPRLDRKVLIDLDVHIPSLPEQQRIASYFTHLDTLIEASRKKVEKYKQVKAASLQALFPQHGERVPKLRFKGCEGEWKKVSFEEVFDFLKNNSLSRAELSDEGSVMNVHYGDVLIKYPEFLDVTQEKMTYVKDSLLADKLYKSCPLQDGDVVIADAAEDETVGKCTELVNVDSTPIVSGLHTIPVRPRFSFASKYLGFFLNSNLFHDQLLVHIQGSKISSISRSAILKTFVYFPSLQEQHLIAQYFTHLDALLTLEQQRYEKLQQVKQASLSQMFVS